MFDFWKRYYWVQEQKIAGKWFCSYCFRDLNKYTVRVDHVVPKREKKDREYRHENTVVCCFECNVSKGDKDLIIFLAERCRSSIG